MLAYHPCDFSQYGLIESFSVSHLVIPKPCNQYVEEKREVRPQMFPDANHQHVEDLESQQSLHGTVGRSGFP